MYYKYTENQRIKCLTMLKVNYSKRDQYNNKIEDMRKSKET